MKTLKVAVLGAGHGGHAMAADLTLAGHEVNLCEAPQFKEKTLDPIIQKGGIEISGVARVGFAKIKLTTTDVKKAVKGTDVIMVVTPAFGHDYFVKECAPHLESKQILVFNTGNWASLRFANLLEKARKTRDLKIVETQILYYSSRISGPAKVFVDGAKKMVKTAAFPAVETEESLGVLNKLYPQFVPAKNVLETNLSNINFIFHPIITILNTGFVERTKGDFIFYKDGVTPTVGKVIEALDEERINVGEKLGLEMISAKQYLDIYYGAKGRSLYEAIQNCPPYLDPEERGPPDFKYRYIAEDVPYGLVPLSSFGKLLGVPTTVTDSIVRLASAVNNTDYFKEGVTIEKFGPLGMSTEEIVNCVTYGDRDLIA